VIRTMRILVCLFLMIKTAEATADVKVLVETLEISPAKNDNFQWPYLLMIPSEVKESSLFVMPNNSGANDDWQAHLQGARDALLGDGVYVMNKLKVPVLIPIFPRPKKDPPLYTHALSRSVMELTEGPLVRPDLQLAAMIDHARQFLARKGVKVEEKVLLLGFSASGMFVNRFTLMHPTLVKKVAFGSPGGWPMAPVPSWESKTLRYPIGTSDLQKIAGAPFVNGGREPRFSDVQTVG
jgi:hypothetical protein